MEKNTTRGIIAVGVTLGLVGLAYYYFILRNKKQEDSHNPNFDAVLTNTGLKANKDNVLIVPFNLDDNKKGKNFAQFYVNNRVIIFNADNSIVTKGTYSDGGKTIKLDSGKEITSGSVFGNLLQTIK